MADVNFNDPSTEAEPSRWASWQVPALDAERRIVAGVAAGLAREAGVDAVWIRLAFLVLLAVGGWGGLLYLVVWGALAQLAYLGRVGSDPPSVKGRSANHRLGGVALITLGLVIFFDSRPGAATAVVWPVGVLGAGMLLIWRQSGERSADRGRWNSLQLVVGLAAVFTAVGMLMSSVLGAPNDQITGATGVFAGVGVAAGLAAISAPWWWRLVRDLDRERQARVRSDERAEVAAHLHDSVLQTLTLIQKHEDDPQTMRNLARRQERELRNWLDPARFDRQGASLRGRLDELATTVEELHGVPVEVVTVGDIMVTGAVEAALAAAREAAVNAARHSGADRIDVYAEVGGGRLELFVRDTGAGFDPESVSDDRRGVSESIIGRMSRVGGTAEIFSEPGAGTEVELSVALPDEPRQETMSPSGDARPSRQDVRPPSQDVRPSRQDVRPSSTESTELEAE